MSKEYSPQQLEQWQAVHPESLDYQRYVVVYGDGFGLDEACRIFFRKNQSCPSCNKKRQLVEHLFYCEFC